MIVRFVIAATLSLVGCPPPGPPAPIPPDATDAQTPSGFDSAPGPQTTCQPQDKCCLACTAMTAICSPQRPDCIPVMAHIDGSGVISRPDGKPVKCADIAAATTKAAMRAAGANCP
jgi:hypothetical protein